MNCAVCVKLRNKDILKAFAVTEIFQQIPHLCSDRLRVIAVNPLSIQCPCKEVVKAIAEGDVPNGSAGPCYAALLGTLRVCRAALGRNRVLPFPGLPASFAENGSSGHLQNLLAGIELHPGIG